MTETDKHEYVFIEAFFMSEASPPTPLICFLKKYFCHRGDLGYQEESPSRRQLLSPVDQLKFEKF